MFRSVSGSPAVISLSLITLLGSILLNRYPELLQQDGGFIQGWINSLSLLFIPDRIITSIFLIITLLLLAPKLENIYGSVKFILIYGLVGIVGKLYFYYYESISINTISVISVSGFLGIYLWLILKRYYRIESTDKIVFCGYASILILCSIVIQSFPYTYIVIGFITGFVLSIIIKPQTFRQLMMMHWGKSLLKSGVMLVVMTFMISSFYIFEWSTVKEEIPKQFDKWTQKIDTDFLRFGDSENVAISNTNHNKFEPPFKEVKAKDNKLYDSILQSISNKSNRVNLAKYTRDSEEVFDTLRQVLDEHPEIYYFDHTKTTFWSDGVLKLGYKYSKSEIAELDNRLNDVVLEVFGNTTNNQSDYDKVKTVHDYIVKNTVYDYDNYLRNSVSDESHSIIGTLLMEKAVCDGYSKSMQFLLGKIGIESEFVTGTGNGEPHAWNKVKIDGNWYNVDSTWNDPIPDRGNNVSYKYFLVTDEYLARDHQWQQEGFPVANDKKYMK